jgi:antitoxin FitA
MQCKDWVACEYADHPVTLGTKEQFRAGAATHGRSMEAERRPITMEAFDRARVPNLARAIRRRHAPSGGVEVGSHPPVPVGPPFRSIEVI